jgi:hypothetical protein
MNRGCRVLFDMNSMIFEPYLAARQGPLRRTCLTAMISPVSVLSAEKTRPKAPWPIRLPMVQEMGDSGGGSSSASRCLMMGGLTSCRGTAAGVVHQHTRNPIRLPEQSACRLLSGSPSTCQCAPVCLSVCLSGGLGPSASARLAAGNDAWWDLQGNGHQAFQRPGSYIVAAFQRPTPGGLEPRLPPSYSTTMFPLEIQRSPGSYSVPV